MILREHLEAARLGWRERDHRPIWQAADGRYGCDRTRPLGQRWQLSRTPWVRQILEDADNDSIREIVIMASAQSAKTAPMLIVLANHCARRPGPKLWITATDDLARDASRERIHPTLERCPDVAHLLVHNRLDKTTWKIRLKTCTVDIAGAQASAALEQNPYEEIFGDEVRMWPAGSLQKVEKRQRSYERAKRYLVSTPNLKGDEFHQRFLLGTQFEWVWPCINCGHDQLLKWSQLKLDDCSVHCEKCDHAHRDEPRIRRHIVENGKWIAQNPTPQDGVVSYHWNAMLPPWIRWRDLVDEWMRANELKKQGNVEALKVFICESLGEPWEERAEETTRAKIDARKIQGYFIRTDWPDAKIILAGADVQQDVVYWAVRAWAPGGVSRLVDCGRVWTLPELQEKVAGKILKHPKFLLIDSGFRTDEVYCACAQYGWKPTKGTDAEYYTIQRDGRFVRQIWRVQLVDAAAATKGKIRGLIKLWEFSSSAAKDALSAFLSGAAGDWGLPEDVPHEYIDHLLGEVKEEILNRDKVPTGRFRWRRLGPNHWLDCECQILIGALDSGIIAAS